MVDKTSVDASRPAEAMCPKPRSLKRRKARHLYMGPYRSMEWLAEEAYRRGPSTSGLSLAENGSPTTALNCCAPFHDLPFCRMGVRREGPNVIRGKQRLGTSGKFTW